MKSKARRPDTNHSSSPFRKQGNDTRFFGVQAKLRVNTPGDHYEVEADKAAEKVVNNKSVGYSTAPINFAATAVQRKGEDETIQEKPIAQTITPLIQRKEDENVPAKEEESVQAKEESVQLKESEIGPAGMAENAGEEAPIRSEQVQAKAEDESVQAKEEEDVQAKEDGEDVQLKEQEVSLAGMDDNPGEQDPIRAAQVQRKAEDETVQAKEEEEVQEKEDGDDVQLQGEEGVSDAGEDSAEDSSTTVDKKLQNSKGSGSPLSSDVKTEMESGFGADFGNVKVHTGTQAQKMSSELGAQAFTHKEDIYFNNGKYDPVSKEGKTLLAHELTHTIQQGTSTATDPQKEREEEETLKEQENDVNVNQLITDSFTDLKTEMPVVDETASSTSTINQDIDPQDASMRSSVRYNRELTADQKAYFKWDLVLAAFRALPAHAKVSDYYLQQWARKQLNLGWSLGQPVPDLESFRASYGTPMIYEVTKKQVPTLYVYEYAGNKSAVRNELLNKQNYNGFWVHVDSITGKKSVLQQRDSFAKYYETHPIGPADVQLVFRFLEIKGIKQPENVKTATKESGTFRRAVERAQGLLFPGVVKGYGLLTPATLEAIKTALKNAQVDKEKTFAGIGGEIKLKDVNNITGLAQDPPGISSRSGEWQDGGVNLRSMPFTPEDPAVKKNPVSLNVVKKSIIAHLAFGTRMTILKETVKGSNGKDPGWYWVMTEKGDEGYVAKHLVQTKLPAPDVRYHLVGEGETLLGIARKYYSPNSEDRVGIVESGGEFRNYVLELARYNENWRGDEAGAVFKAGFDPNDPKSWKHTVVRKGMRMWIPSSAEMYYLIHKRPASKKFDNTNWAEDGGQWIIDNSPVTMLINSYLDWWATIPQEQRERGVQKYYQQQLALYEKLQADWSWLDKYIAPIAPLIPGGGAVISVSLIYDLYISFNIGYFEFLSKSDPKMLVLNAERSLRNLTQLEHYKGLVQGFVEGLYDWGKDFVDSFAAIGEAIGMVADLLTDPETYKKIGEFAGDAFEYVTSNIDEIQKSLSDMNFMDVVAGLIGGMRTILKSKGKEMGKGAAQALMKFAGGSPFEQGFSIGKIIGFLVPEIVLAVASEGIWVAVKGALKSMQLVTKILKPILKGIKVGVELLKSAASAAKSVVAFIGNFIKSVLSKTKKGVSKFWEKLQELFEGFQRFLKSKYDDAFKSKNAGKIDVEDYTETNKSRLRDEAKKDLNSGDDYNERLEDAIKAFAIIEMNDALDPSPPAIEVVSFLNATIDLPKNDKFTSRHLGGDLYEISFNPKYQYTQGKNNVSSNIRDMMHSQKIAPDLLDKGVHFNVGKIELRAAPDHLGGVTFKPVHPGMAAKNKDLYQKAVKEASEALQSLEFRNWLKKHAVKGFEMASQTGSAKALEFKFLIEALEKI